MPIQVLEKIGENLEKLNEKIEVMIELQKHDGKDAQQPLTAAPLDVMTLLSMPDHLRKTATMVCRLGWTTAERALRERGLLVIMGHVKKERCGRKTYFFLDRDNHRE